MTKRISFTKHLHKITPKFREEMNLAESTEDVKKFFSYAVKELIKEILLEQKPEEEISISEEDIIFVPERPPYFEISESLISKIKDLWEKSDLPQIIEKLAEGALGRYKHLERNPEKTEQKIRM